MVLPHQYNEAKCEMNQLTSIQIATVCHRGHNLTQFVGAVCKKAVFQSTKGKTASGMRFSPGNFISSIDTPKSAV